MATTREMLHDTTCAYKEVDYHGIEYTMCKDYEHISRYRRLRQVIHYLEGTDRFMTLETQNKYSYSGVTYEYYTVTVDRENRLDLISYDYYNTISYAWLIAYVNGISDGYTVYEGRTLIIPTSITDLFGNNRILSPIPVSTLSLGTE